MDTELITITEYCSHYNIQTSFIYSLQHAGLIEITVIEKEEFIPLDQLPQLEQYVRWHYDLDINTEGIETISHMLKKLNDLQAELEEIKSRLKLYE